MLRGCVLPNLIYSKFLELVSIFILFIWFVVVFCDFHNLVNEQDVKTLSTSPFHKKIIYSCLNKEIYTILMYTEQQYKCNNVLLWGHAGRALLFYLCTLFPKFD